MKRILHDGISEHQRRKMEKAYKERERIMQTITINVTIEADQVTMLKIQRLLACLHFDTRQGHSATLAMDIDGDGADRVTVSGIDIEKFKDESIEGTYMRRKRALVEWISAEDGTDD